MRLFSFAPLTALGLYAAGRRWFSPAAGLLAAVVHLTTPWIDRVSIIALAEGGLTFYLFATLFAVMLAVERMHDGRSPRRWVLMAGLVAGSGMACKYTGLMQVVLPAAIALILAPWFVGRRQSRRHGRTTRKAHSSGRCAGAAAPAAADAAAPRAIALEPGALCLGS